MNASDHRPRSLLDTLMCAIIVVFGGIATGCFMWLARTGSNSPEVTQRGFESLAIAWLVPVVIVLFRDYFS